MWIFFFVCVFEFPVHKDTETLDCGDLNLGWTLEPLGLSADFPARNATNGGLYMQRLLVEWRNKGALCVFFLSFFLTGRPSQSKPGRRGKGAAEGRPTPMIVFSLFVPSSRKLFYPSCGAASRSVSRRGGGHTNREEQSQPVNRFEVVLRFSLKFSLKVFRLCSETIKPIEIVGFSWTCKERKQCNLQC